VKKIILSAAAALVVIVGTTLLLLSYYQDEVPLDTTDEASETVFGEDAASAEIIEEAELFELSINIHNHFLGKYESVAEYELAIESMFDQMDLFDIDQIVLMPQPYPDEERYQTDIDMLAEAVSNYSDRLSFFAGGESLNKMLQAQSGVSSVSRVDLDEFEDRARYLMALGAKGFGEMTALHFSLGEGHPFEEVAPDHQLLLLLADLAAEYDVPLDLHMEAVTQDMAFPESERITSNENPATLNENIKAFTRLLNHNKDTKIIWEHAGWDNSGKRTPELMGKLLSNYDNLFMSIKIGPDSVDKTRPMDRDGELRSEWLDLFEEFPDRFLIGSDQFYSVPGSNLEIPKRNEGTEDLLSLLPADLVYQFNVINPSVLLSN
jgi:hypothetical protein